MNNIETLADYVAFAADFSPGKGWIYRGQTKTTDEKGWELRPKAGRDDYTGGFERYVDQKMPMKSYDLEWFSKWRTEAIAYSNKVPADDLECLAYAQHYGLATRLLDWSRNPLVALYFAVSGDEKVDGGVYLITGLPTLTASSLAQSVGDVSFYQPPPFDRRLAAQEGLFTFHPRPQSSVPIMEVASQYESNPVPHTNLHTVKVPWRAKALLRQQLADLGVTRKSLFPDLDGLSDYINWGVRLKAAQFSARQTFPAGS